jgi:hypothetical protein
MHADQLIKGEELNCLRHRRCAADACLVILDSDSSVSATIDHFLTWLADATNAGLRQMYVRPCLNICNCSLCTIFAGLQPLVLKLPSLIIPWPSLLL